MNVQKKIFLLLFVVLFAACEKDYKTDVPQIEGTAFVMHESDKTGIDFSNDLELTLDLNIFNYMYFYNGGGLGAGDFNNDGKVDLFFSANLKDNKLYLNEGELKFKDVSAEAGITNDEAWSTGVSVVDINQDGMLDIYVSQVGDFKTLKGHNHLFVCESIDDKGVPHYKEQSAEYGLDIVGFCTQASFFDYDLDGDLDLYQMNHSLHANGTFGPKKTFSGKAHPLSGDKLLRNDDGKYTEVTAEVGIYNSVIGYGLGIATGDVNLDGYPDIYISNDFHENDYLYINQKNGTFKEQLTEQIMHTSRFSMGVDIADINNDAFPDIFSLDMLPEDPYILKKSEGEDALDIFRFKLGYGYNHQYAKNNLQLNNGNNTFSEIAMFANIHATDWSWATLMLDFDNNGFKDIFVTNGIPKRMNDIDYINFVSNDDVQHKMQTGNMEETDLSLINKIPEIKLSNKFYLNNGKFQYDDLKNNLDNNNTSYSNSAIYADLDGDGDLDIVTNNVNDKAFIYENTASAGIDNNFLALELNGPKGNINSIGSKVIVYKKDEKILAEKFPVRGFQGSQEIALHLGLGEVTAIDSVLLIWPDNTYQKIDPSKSRQAISYKKGLPKFNYKKINTKVTNTFALNDITEKVGLKSTHKENPFVEFNREPLIPHMTSSEGPALAVGDLNGDGLDDLFIGSSKRKQASIQLQTKDGTFVNHPQEAIRLDSIYEQVDAVFEDVNGDGHLDLVVASGGNEYYNTEDYLRPRIYLNDGAANFTAKEDAFDKIYMTASCVLPYDFTGDGIVDLFLGGRAVPWAYGETPKSYLLKNDGTGKFTDVTAEYAKSLTDLGMVMHGHWFDIDGDKDQDLILSVEWDKVYAFINDGNKFTKKALTDKKGLWSFTIPYDYDKDGDMDLIAGNLGLNSRLKASKKEPIRVYYNDYDDNGKKEQILSYYLQGKEIPFSNMMELQKQIPKLKKHFLLADNFAKASMSEIFGKEKLKSATLLEANYLSNAVLINQGDLNFETMALPERSQFSTYKTGIEIQANEDNKSDLLLFGNYYDCNIQMGRYDANFGTLLISKDAGKFAIEDLNGLPIKGQVRRIEPIIIAGKKAYVLVRNNDSALVIAFEEK